MAFDFSTLITDRTLEDVAARNEKGSYNATDLNRVDACLDDLVARLSRVGCNVPGYKRVKIERAVTPSSRLPEGYTELEYIQSTGTQYIDTGIVPKNNTRVDADCDITYGTDWVMILGSYDPNKYFSWWANGAKIYAYYGTSNKNVAGENGKQTLSANKNIWTAGNSAMSFSEVSFTANFSIYLFTVNNGGNYSKASMKLYSCQIYDNDTLVRDYVPCQKPDGTIGLWDDVNSVFYGNAGTGSFTAGPVIERPKDPNDGLDPYTWYESDTPTFLQLSQYRANVYAVRSALQLPDGTPVTPDSMRRLTTAEANSIEAILLALNFILNNIPAAVRHCGVTVCGSKGVIA